MKPILMILALTVALAAPCSAKAPPDKETDENKAEVENPVRKISEMMTQAAKLLEKIDTGKATQEEQKKILEQLDRLIEMAQQSSSSSSSQQAPKPSEQQDEPKPGQPQNSSESGSSGMQDEQDVRRSVTPRLGRDEPDVKEMWGKFQDAPREEVQQLFNEKLPLKYRQLLYLYLKALSEKQ
jgi:uncharacterized membrane-anchored protein YhcB (DUF1043 family)